MQPHRQRVIDEKAELDKKCAALRLFMASRMFDEAIDAGERSRLVEQSHHMAKYSDVLERRIAYFKIRPEEGDYGYGNCPQCAAPGVSRERRPNGNDQCANRHVYPSKEATTC